MTGTLTEKDAVEVVQGRKRKGCTRRTSEAAVMFVASKRTVHPLLKVQKSEFVISMKRNNTEEFQEDVVNDTSEVISGSDRQGGTRRSCESAQNNGGTQTAAQDCIITQESNVESPSKNKSSKAFKEEIVKYALEVVPGGKGKGGTRGNCEAARKYGVSNTSVHDWVRAQDCGFKRASKSELTDAFKQAVVHYALEVVPSGQGKGGTRGTYEAAMKYGVSQPAVHRWLSAHESGFVKVSRTEFSDAFKQEVVQYALEVVPGGKGKGGTRGLNEAGIVYGVPCPTLRGWARSQLFCGQSVVRRISNTIKSEVVRYALEEAASTGNDAVAISNASQKYSVEPAIIKGWIRHSQSSSIIYAG